MKIGSLKINGINNPLGYAYEGVTLSWIVEEATASKQKETVVKVASDKDMKNVIFEKRGVLPCSGVELEVKPALRTAYYVTVEVTAEDGSSAVSEVASFETGKMDEAWEAKWIGTGADYKAHPVLFKEFETGCQKAVSKARLYITGVGLYEAFINGKKVGEDLLAPFFNDYNCALQVQTYDVTNMVSDKMKFEISLANGWYKGNLGYDGDKAVYGNQFAALAELRIQYEDGSEEVLATDESFMVTPSDITYSDIYDGEGIDRTLYAKERPVESVVLVDMSSKKLVDRYSLPLKIMEELPVAEIITTPAGETVLDFGQNFAGVVSFHVKDFAPGTTITLEHGEVLQQGNFYHDNYREAKTLITYVSDGREEWVTPEFTYMGFRYVKVTGWPKQLAKEDFRGCVIYSRLEQTGFVTTGHDKVNKLISNALWGLKSNFLDMPTDCPQRNERLGWTGDAQVFAPTASFFMDTKAFYRKFTWDIRNDQVLRDGAVAHFMPNFHGEQGGAAVWADAATFIPDTVYDYFGDKNLLKENYPLMKDWVDWITRGDEARQGGPKNLFDFAFTFGDWLAMDGVTSQSMKGGTEDGYLASVYYYASALKVKKAAEILGLTEDAAYYENLAEKIKKAVLDEYFTPNGRLALDTQTAYIVALYFGLYRDRDILIRYLTERFKKDCNRIRGGFVGAPLTCITLADNDMFELAMHIFLQEKFPGWLHCVDLGATTIWERWNSLLDDGSISGTGMNSLNHYAYGSVINFLVRNVAGITAAEPGYRKVRIVPKPHCRLGNLELKYKSASGTYEVSWKIENAHLIKVHVKVPFDCEAELILPEQQEGSLLTAGEYDFEVETEKDYESLYSYESMLDELSSDPRALEVLKEELPVAYGMAMSDDIEALSKTLTELKFMPWFGCKAEDVDKAAARLMKLKTERG